MSNKKINYNCIYIVKLAMNDLQEEGKRMASFGHGGNAKEISRKNKIEYDKIIDFSANINPLGMPNSVRKEL